MPIEETELEAVDREDVLDIGRIKYNFNIEALRQFVNYLEFDVVDGGDSAADHDDI